MKKASTEDLRIFLMEVTDEIGSAYPETRDTKISARLLRDILTELLANREAQAVAWVTMQPEFCDDERTAITNKIEADKYSLTCYDLTPLYTAPPAPAVVKLPTEFYSDEGVVVRLEEVMAALALVGVKYERKGNACRAAMLAQPVSQGCEWTYDEHDYKWDSACGEAWMFSDGGPIENGVKFCQSCGKPVLLAAAPEGGNG